VSAGPQALWAKGSGESSVDFSVWKLQAGVGLWSPVELCHAVLRCADRFAADELELKPEPSLESFGVRLPKGQQQQQQEEQQQQQEQQQQEEANGAADSDDDAG